MLTPKVKTDFSIQDWLDEIQARRDSIMQVYFDGWISDMFLDDRLAELDREEETCRKYAAQSATRIPDDEWETELPF